MGEKNEKNVRPNREGKALFCIGEFPSEEGALHGYDGEVPANLDLGTQITRRRAGAAVCQLPLTPSSPGWVESRLVVFSKLSDGNPPPGAGAQPTV